MTGTSAPQTAAATAITEVPEFSISTPLLVSGLDTGKNTDLYLANLVTERLEVGQSDGNFLPVLARSTTVSRDKIVYQLRPDVKFSDGKPLTVDDVVFSIQRAADLKTSPFSGAALTIVASVTATGPAEVTVALKNADNNARSALSWYVHIWQKSQVEANPQTFGSAEAIPVGTGPYVVSRMANSEVLIDRNESYWGDRPRIKRIRWKYVPDESTKQLAMRSGELNMAVSLNLTAARDWAAVPGATILSLSSPFVAQFALDTSAAPLDDVHVRRAVAYAIDRPNLTKIIYGEHAQPLVGLVSVDSLAVLAPSRADAEQFMKSLPQYQFDLEKAKTELAQSKYARGATVDAYTVAATFPHGLPVLQSLRQNLKPLGIEVNIREVTQQEWRAKFGENKNRGIFTFLFGPVSGIDPLFYTSRMLGKANLIGTNVSSWAPAELEEPLAVLLQSDDKAARYTAARTVLSAVARDVPWIPLANPNQLYIIGKGFRYETPRQDSLEFANGTWVHRIIPAR